MEELEAAAAKAAAASRSSSERAFQLQLKRRIVGGGGGGRREEEEAELHRAEKVAKIDRAAERSADFALKVIDYTLLPLLPPTTRSSIAGCQSFVSS